MSSVDSQDVFIPHQDRDDFLRYKKSAVRVLLTGGVVVSGTLSNCNF